MAGADVVDLGLASTDLVLLRGREPRRARRDVHREPQPRAVQRHQALPRRRGADRRGHRPAPDQGDGRRRAARAGRGPGPGRAPRPAARVRRPRPLVRRRRRARAAPRRRRHRQRRRRAHRAGGVLGPAVRAHACCSASSTARSRTTRPTRSSSRTSRTSQRAVVDGDGRRRPRVRRRRRPRLARRRPGAAGVGLDHHRDPRRGDPRTARDAAAETVVHNLICSKAVPEVVREHGGTPDPHPGRPLVHQAGDGRDRRGLRRRALRALLLPRQLPRRLRDHRRDHGARAAVDVRACRCRSCASRSSATRRRARSTRASPTPRR